ncbi:MAG: hypothetical protein QM710_00805 [Flavobacterium sp.]
MKWVTVNRFFLKYALTAFLLCLTVSCFNSSKSLESNKQETKTISLPQKQSDKFRNKLNRKTLQDYMVSTPEVKFTKKYKTPFDKLKFDKVIAYDYEGSEEPFPSVFKNGEFIPIIEKQQALTEKQADFLIDKILTSNDTYGEATAACFNPHLAFVFYKNSKKVFEVDICLGCNSLISSVAIPASQFHKFKFKNGQEGVADGFSKQGKKRIRGLATELDFFYSNNNPNYKE